MVSVSELEQVHTALVQAAHSLKELSRRADEKLFADLLRAAEQAESAAYIVERRINPS